MTPKLPIVTPWEKAVFADRFTCWRRTVRYCYRAVVEQRQPIHAFPNEAKNEALLKEAAEIYKGWRSSRPKRKRGPRPTRA